MVSMKERLATEVDSAFAGALLVGARTRAQELRPERATEFVRDLDALAATELTSGDKGAPDGGSAALAVQVAQACAELGAGLVQRETEARAVLAASGFPRQLRSRGNENRSDLLQRRWLAPAGSPAAACNPRWRAPAAAGCACANAVLGLPRTAMTAGWLAGKPGTAKSELGRRLRCVNITSCMCVVS